MKKFIYLLTFFFTFSANSQELYWYDVFLDVKGENASAFVEAVDNYYSSIDFPEGSALTLNAIQNKSEWTNATHFLNFAMVFKSKIFDQNMPLLEGVNIK